MDVHTSDRMAERGQGATGVRIGERNWATRDPGEEEVKRRKCRRCVGAMEATGRRPLRKTSVGDAGVGASEEQTHHISVGVRVREGVENRFVGPAIPLVRGARPSQLHSCCLPSLLVPPPYLHRRRNARRLRRRCPSYPPSLLPPSSPRSSSTLHPCPAPRLPVPP
jgi:hypothetical protein